MRNDMKNWFYVGIFHNEKEVRKSIAIPNLPNL